ncbi:MAG: hypothetical protein ABFR75_00415 [Acidobacteriota bacterium]
MKIRNLIIIFVVLIFLNGCNIFENKSTSSSMMLIGSITGTDLQGNDGSTTIFSDVFISGGGSGSSEQDGTVINDNAVIEIGCTTIAPSSTQPTSYYNDIVIEQIKVEYSRPDGRNVEGVDVPLTFTQPVNFRLKAPEIDKNGVVIDYYNIPFIIVRHVAKMEPPLRDLKELGAEKVLQLIAKITVYGKDGGGRDVEPASGSVSVWCANFAD